MSQLLDPRKAARLGIAEAEGAHRRHVVPLYDSGDRDEAVIAGSAVLIAVPSQSAEGETVLLVTAAHVADYNDDGTLFVPGAGGGPDGPRDFVPLADIVRGEATRTPLPASGTREPDDPYDIAFAEIDLTKLGPTYGPVWAIRAEPDEAEDPHSLYVIHGYPRTKNGRYSPGQLIRPTVYAHVAMATTFDEVPERFDPAFHVALRYDRKNAYNLETGGSKVAPDLDKMSGGPIWGVPSDATLLGMTAELPLVGICIEQPRGTKAVVGTRMNVVLAAIAKRRPDLIHGLPKTRASKVNIELSSSENDG